MRISEQVRRQVIKLIDEAPGLEPLDLETFTRWVQASYEVLAFDRWQQQRFGEYFGSSTDSSSMRLAVGVWLLRRSLCAKSDDEVCSAH